MKLLFKKDFVKKIILLKKKLLSKLEDIDVRDYSEHVSTSEIGNLKLTSQVNLFRNRAKN